MSGACTTTARDPSLWRGAITWGVVALAAIGACTEQEASGPPGLAAGRDACAECGMSIVDLPFAVGALTEREGHTRHVVFDDMGCFLVWRGDLRGEAGPDDQGLRVLSVWTMTLDGNSWMPVGDATFVTNSARRTPMDSGIAAYSSLARAREACAGEVEHTSFDKLQIPPGMQP